MTTNFREDCQREIHLNFKGQIVTQSMLLKRYPTVDWDRLHSLIEDHICKADALDGSEEVIVWHRVWKEWDA